MRRILEVFWDATLPDAGHIRILAALGAAYAGVTVLISCLFIGVSAGKALFVCSLSGLIVFLGVHLSHRFVFLSLSDQCYWRKSLCLLVIVLACSTAPWWLGQLPDYREVPVHGVLSGPPMELTIRLALFLALAGVVGLAWYADRLSRTSSTCRLSRRNSLIVIAVVTLILVAVECSPFRSSAGSLFDLVRNGLLLLVVVELVRWHKAPIHDRPPQPPPDEPFYWIEKKRGEAKAKRESRTEIPPFIEVLVEQAKKDKIDLLYVALGRQPGKRVFSPRISAEKCIKMSRDSRYFIEGAVRHLSWCLEHLGETVEEETVRQAAGVEKGAFKNYRSYIDELFYKVFNVALTDRKKHERQMLSLTGRLKDYHILVVACSDCWRPKSE